MRGRNHRQSERNGCEDEREAERKQENIYVRREIEQCRREKKKIIHTQKNYSGHVAEDINGRRKWWNSATNHNSFW